MLFVVRSSTTLVYEMLWTAHSATPFIKYTRIVRFTTFVYQTQMIIHSSTKHIYQTTLTACEFSASELYTARVSNVDSRQFVESTFTTHLPTLLFPPARHVLQPVKRDLPRSVQSCTRLMYSNAPR